MFDLMNETEAAKFFARMALASHGAERDTGHTGNFFNILWSIPAIKLSGPPATGAWMEEFGYGISIWHGGRTARSPTRDRPV